MITTNINQNGDSESQNKLVKVKEAAQILAIDERTIWRMLDAGELPKIKIRSATRIPIRSLDNLINGGGTR